jgi:isopenicillin N synthase-like dioxygenase
VPHPPQGWYHRGYSGVGREKVVQMVFDEEGLARERKRPDFKESYEMGNEEDTAKLRNIWPAEEVIPGFRQFFISFYDVCYAMELKLLRAIAVGMGLEDDFFIDYHRSRNNQIRLLHYPPVEEELMATGKVDSIGAHTDFGTLTMLFQDHVGGLEVEDIHNKGTFIQAPFIPGTIVVNIGDFLMRWSNDELRSTLHHVRAPPAEEPTEPGKVRMTRERYSIPYFVSADNERTIDCVPGCWGPDRPKKYEPVNSMEYLEMRLNATY